APAAAVDRVTPTAPLGHQRVFTPREARAPDPGRPVIDEIVLEKTEVCEGEENLVTVEAHTPGHVDDAYLHGVVAGQPGLAVPVVTFRTRDGEVPPRQILVFGRGDEPTVVPLPAFEVKDCVAPRRITIDYRLRANTEAEFDLVAKLVDLGAATPFHAASYRWDFGDGATAVTREAWTTHSYEDRRQDQELYAKRVVRVEAIGDDGERVVGRQTFVMQNAAFANLVYAGVVSLSVRLTPRFPEVGDDGVVRQGIHLWHARDRAVRISRVIERRNFLDGRDPVDHEIDAVGLLGTTSIPPAGIDLVATLDTGAEPELASLQYFLEGESVEGIPVRGAFPVMVPPAKPTRDHHVAVRDPALTARILRARELLGKDFVTDEELWALEREGEFDDLPAEGTSPHPPETYGDLPPHPNRPGEPSPDTPLPSADTMPVVPFEP
ncbi:MAG: hypothetical protein KC464_28495, partial [Myxococcales bacterium]|nr:hypothetical protein [Myxococcales bacterium]